MKKTLVSAITTALVVGAASTTFAATNPFSDVPSDHWAYDAVAQLASDGIIDGYGDDTFKGSKNITRYEMAQMVAKAMAKNTSGVDKALVDKLAAEFSDELNNLGVRVANLERNADKVKFTGMVRYDYHTLRVENENRQTGNNVKFRLYPNAEVNDNWHVQARLQGVWSPKDDTTKDMKLSYVYAEGKYDNFGVNIGKMPLYSYADDGLIFDAMFSGVEATVGNKLKAIVDAGRIDITDNEIGNGMRKNPTNDKVANYQALQLVYGADKLTLGAGYHHLSSKGFGEFDSYGADKDKANIWTVGASYAFDKNFTLGASYAKNNKAEKYDQAESVQLKYKGASAANKGSFGLFTAYRNLGQNVALSPTYDDMYEDMRGFSFGGEYTLMKNVIGYASYTFGNELTTGKNANLVFGRLKMVF